MAGLFLSFVGYVVRNGLRLLKCCNCTERVVALCGSDFLFAAQRSCLQLLFSLIYILLWSNG